LAAPDEGHASNIPGDLSEIRTITHPISPPRLVLFPGNLCFFTQILLHKLSLRTNMSVVPFSQSAHFATRIGIRAGKSNPTGSRFS
jgi:hypothetical protein